MQGELTQQVWGVQILYIPKKSLVLAWLLGNNTEAFGIFCFKGASSFIWGLGPYQIVYANNVIYGGALGHMVLV